MPGMIQIPIMAGVVLCKEMRIDLSAVEVSLVGVFTSRRFRSFPTPREKITVYSVLADGIGEGTLEVRLVEVASDRVINRYKRWFVFPDRDLVVTLEVCFRKCSFQSPGRHRVEIRFDDQIASEWTFEVMKA